MNHSTKLPQFNFSTQEAIQSFQSIVYTFYTKQKRTFPWRDARDPYAIAVSEFMLQQTQTDRVLPKFIEWMYVFPTIKDLGIGSQSQVLNLWQGLGYNRRALSLHAFAKRVEQEYDGNIPLEPEELQKFTGIGPYTAAAIVTFSTNQPLVLIETNIRTVFLYHSAFNFKQRIDDKQIYPLIERTLDRSDPRSWYYALMDYGVYLKKQYGNPNAMSKQYTKQTPFVGSKRQLRGAIIRQLLKKQTMAITQIHTHFDDSTRDRIIADLEQEGFLEWHGNTILLRNN